MTMTRLAPGPQPAEERHAALVGWPPIPQQSSVYGPTPLAAASELVVHLGPGDTFAVEVRSCGEITVRAQLAGQPLRLTAARGAIDTLRKLHSAIGWALADHDTRAARPYLVARVASADLTFGASESPPV